MKVVVTRPLLESESWLMALTDAGYDAVHLPLMDVRPVADRHAVQSAWVRIASFDAVMFVSGNAVRHFYADKPANARLFDGQSAVKARALVTGPGSQRALLRLGAQLDCVDAPTHDAEQFDSEALWQVMGYRVVPGWQVLIVRGGSEDSGGAGDLALGQGRDWFAQKVREAGGSVEYLLAYQRSLPVWDAAQHQGAQQAVLEGAVWLLTSSQAVRHLQLLQPNADWSAARAVVTHPRIAEVVHHAGFGQVVQSRPALAGVFASLESLR